MVEPALLSNQELRDAIDAQARRVAAEQARLTRLAHEAIARGIATPGWIAVKTRRPRRLALRMCSNGAALRDMPEAAAAFDGGDIDEDHVQVLASAQRFSPKAFEKVEAELVDDARTCRFDVFHRRVKYFRQLADPDDVEREAQTAHEQRNLHASRTFEECVRVDGTMDPVGGSIFLNELERLQRIEFDADWKEARERLGDAATSGDLRRTPAQRRHDALVEMATRSAAMPEHAKHARYLLTVHVGYETLHGRICELADGTVLTPGQVVPLLTNADVERAVFGPEGRVIDLGRRERLFKGGARRAVEISDLECTHESCDVRYERCDVDHVQPWALGGPTDRANGRVRCPRHNPGRRRSPPDDP
jgi:hypothetical protein